jgi:hypothetical protein
MALLANDALKGKRIVLSVSDSPDLGRLGLAETHFRLALGEMAQNVLLSGGKLAYGGHLSPTGYTAFLVNELEKYGRRDRPLLICLAWQNHRTVPLSELTRMKDELGLKAEFVYLDPNGHPVDPNVDRTNEPVTVDDPVVRKKSLSAMRRYMAGRTHAWVFLGGRRRGFEGDIPGLMEEAFLALEANKPIYLAGGFGGVTLDIAKALSLDDGIWLPPMIDGAPDDSRFVTGRRMLEGVAGSPSWNGISNGLSQEENRRLAASHRPSDIAVLVSIGLGRLQTPT